MDSFAISDSSIDERLRRLTQHLLQCPSAQDFDPVTLDADLWQYLYVIDILTQQDRADVGLRIRLTGTALDTMIGRALGGERLEQVVRGPHSEKVLAGFQRCAVGREPVWMRQVVKIDKKAPRFIEGVAVYLDPERIYGGVVVGDVSPAADGFDSRVLRQA